MPFFIETYDNPEQAHIRQDVYQEHLDYLEAVAPQLLAHVAAQQLIEADPFYRNGLFADVKISRWRKAYLDGQNFL